MTSRLLAAALVASGALTLVGAATASPQRPAAGETVVARLVAPAPIRARPTSASELRGIVAAVRPLTHQNTALPVVRSVGRHGRTWLLVRLPGRPAGRTGWIARDRVRLSVVPWKVVVDRARRTVSLHRSGSLVSRYPVVVGKAGTPTPRGNYFVVEHVRQGPGSLLGPWALATSAFSHVLQEFDGGPGQVALHGRAGELALDPLGTARSHGCVRLDNDVIRLFARTLPNGTPIEIR
jgi:lipoprotein-anchoring transpeptidase ErfK/SrfK